MPVWVCFQNSAFQKFILDQDYYESMFNGNITSAVT